MRTERPGSLRNGQPPNKGQKGISRCVCYSEVLLYMAYPLFPLTPSIIFNHFHFGIEKYPIQLKVCPVYNEEGMLQSLRNSWTNLVSH